MVDTLHRKLTFSPLAWMKILTMLHAGDTEVGGYGVARDPDDLLYVDDFYTVKQTCSSVSVKFDDSSIADYFDDRVDEGLRPAQFGRIWIHTHPDISPNPSMTDEETFADSFGAADFAVMFIISRDHHVYARMALRAGPGGRVDLPVEVDWERWPLMLKYRGPEKVGLEVNGWLEEYHRNVSEYSYSYVRPAAGQSVVTDAADGFVEWSHPGDRGDVWERYEAYKEERSEERWKRAYMEMVDDQNVVNAFEQGAEVIEEDDGGVTIRDREGRPVAKVDADDVDVIQDVVDEAEESEDEMAAFEEYQRDYGPVGHASSDVAADGGPATGFVTRGRGVMAAAAFSEEFD